MGSQTIYHKSKNANFVLNFSATENNLFGEFTAENDGQIYAIETINVATLTIGGSVVTLPLASPIANSNEQPYAVAITKITNGITASVTIKTRRVVDKTTTLAVPDIGAFSGRYIYVLQSNNTVYKLDSNLLLPSNYVSGGSWTVNPVVTTITLPTLPNSATYTGTPQFVKHNGETKVFLCGGEATNFRWYASYIKISDDTVWNLDLTTQNSYTQLSNVATLGSAPRNIIYDHLNEIIYLKTKNTGAGNRVLKLDLITLVTTELGAFSFADMRMISTHINQFQFNPTDNQFIGLGDFNLIANRSYNHKLYPNTDDYFAYRYDNNTRVCTGTSFGYVNFFNKNGELVNSLALATTGALGCMDIKCFYRATSVVMSRAGHYAIVNYSNSTYKMRISPLVEAVTYTYINNWLNCHYSNIFTAFCTDVNRVYGVRMIVFKQDQTNADFGYYDFPQSVVGACSTQILI